MEYEMVEHFGPAYWDIDYWTVKRHEYVWTAKNQARPEAEKRQQEEFERNQP
jgi:hypothetical protein